MYFVIKLLSPRPTFPQDITPEEIAIMQLHRAYWKNYMDQGIMLIYGPVLDPAGVYGLGIVDVKSEDHLKPLLVNDPAARIGKYVYHQMMAVVPSPL